MKLLIDEPCTRIKDAHILFGFDPIAQTLGRAIVDSEPGFNLGIYGPWGTGKTTLLNLIRAQVEQVSNERGLGDSFLSIEFSAWEFQDLEYPLQALAQVIFSAVKARASAGGVWKDTLGTDAPARLFKYIADHTPRQFALSILGNGIEYSRESKGGQNFATLCSELLPLKLGERIVTYVDDLDRCPPDFQVRFLDSIKTFFGLPGYVFVLALDHERVLSALTKSTLHQLDGISEANSYLDKVIHISWHLRPPSVEERQEFLTKSITLLNKHNNEIVIDLAENKEEIVEVARLEDNPRRLKALLNGFALRWRDQKKAKFDCYVTYTQLQKVDPRFLALVETATILNGPFFLPELRNFLIMKEAPTPPEKEIDIARSNLRQRLGGAFLDDIDSCRTSQICRLIGGDPGERLFSPAMWPAVVRGQGVIQIRKEPEPVLRFFQFGSYLTYLPLKYACDRQFMQGYAVEFGGPTFNDRDNYLLVSGRGDGEFVFGLSDPLDVCRPDTQCVIITPVITQVALWLVAKKLASGILTFEKLNESTIGTYKPDTTCYRLVKYHRRGRAPELTYDPATALERIQKIDDIELLVMQEPDVTRATNLGHAQGNLWLGEIFPDYPFSALYTHKNLFNTKPGRRAANAVVKGVKRALHELRRASEDWDSTIGSEVLAFISKEYALNEDVAKQALTRLSKCFATEDAERNFALNLSKWHEQFVNAGILSGNNVNFNTVYPRELLQSSRDESDA